MPIVDFPFISPGGSITAGPYLPIRVTNPDTGEFLHTYGLVDTGANSCCIPAELATRIGHRVDAVGQVLISTAGGNVPMYPHTCRIDIYHVNRGGYTDVGRIVYTISDRRVAVLKDLSFVLLGRSDFLDGFMLSVDFPNRRFSIRA